MTLWGYHALLREQRPFSGVAVSAVRYYVSALRAMGALWFLFDENCCLDRIPGARTVEVIDVLKARLLC
jgi:hypothetical protein